MSAFLVFLLVAGCSGTDDQAENGATPQGDNGPVANAPANPLASEYAGVPELIGDSLLRFAGGGEYSPGFRDIHYIGQIPTRTKAPFVIISGVECAFCDAPPSVLMHSPSDARPAELRSEPGWYPYPGRITAAQDPEDILQESRVFWGECLADQPPGLLHFATDFTDGEPARQSVRVTLVQGDSLVAADGLVPWSTIDAVTGMVMAGLCQEIEPVDRPGDF